MNTIIIDKKHIYNLRRSGVWAETLKSIKLIKSVREKYKVTCEIFKVKTDNRSNGYVILENGNTLEKQLEKARRISDYMNDIESETIL